MLIMCVALLCHITSWFSIVKDVDHVIKYVATTVLVSVIRGERFVDLSWQMMMLICLR